MKVRISWESRKALFRYPGGRASRIAVLGSWFRESGEVRVFRGGWTPETRSYAPEVIVGTWTQLRELARRGSAVPTRAVIVVSKPGSPLLAQADRELLWCAFHVPVFEQVIGARGKLLAAECEAHDGVHVDAMGVTAPGFALDHSPCPCGLKTPRLASLQPVARVRAISAFAR